MIPLLKQLTFLFLSTVTGLAQTVPQSITDGLAPCVIFLMQDVQPGKDASGTGFLVRADEKVFLVTAGHVARKLGPKFKIVMPGADGKAITAIASSIKWIESDSADVALVPIHQDEANLHKMLLNRSMPIHFLSGRPLPPSRDVPLTVMGYPLGLGSTGYVSPLSLETRAASGFITLPRFDNQKLATFILLQDPSIGGLSGGPVFDTGKSYFAGGRQLTVREGVSVVGLIHGVISDKTGGKFAAVVPATEIINLIRSAMETH
jgi:hypothetical protein